MVKEDAGIPSLSVVIPSYNEEENLPKTVPEIVSLLRNANISYELILVDNGSFDNTRNVIKNLMKEYENIRLVTVPVNIGWGNGVVQGYSQARGKYVAYMCADSQVPNQALIDVYRRIVLENTDKVLVKVRRISRDDGVMRCLSSVFYNLLVNVLFGGVSPDANGTPKVFGRNLLGLFDLKYKDFFIDAELLIKVKRNKIRITEVPFSSAKRKAGKSSIRVLKDSITVILDALKFRLNI
jgi:glycosyltransferase involved in cell wall biosynthesis